MNELGRVQHSRGRSKLYEVPPQKGFQRNLQVGRSFLQTARDGASGQIRPEDCCETVCIAIFAGGDVDTTAAMAGAISGAHVGLERLPPVLAQQLNDQGTLGFKDLVELAHRCYDVKSREIQGLY